MARLRRDRLRRDRLGWHVLVRVLLGCCATAALLTGCAAPAPSATGSASTAPSAESPTPTPTPTPTPSPTPTPTSAGACLSAGLAFALESRPTDSGMGSFFWNLSVTNTSDSPCTVEGYPTILLLNAAGEPIGAASGREPRPGATPGVVPLAPGASAYSLLHLTQAGAYGCPLVPVTQVAVTFPAGGAAQAVPTPNPIQGCDDQKTQLVRVTRLAPAKVTF